MPNKSWYICIRGETIGPISKRELSDLARREGITPRTLVSQNQVTWMEASTLTGIAFGHVDAEGSHSTNQVPIAGAGLGLGLLLGGAGVMAIGFVLVVLLAAWDPGDEHALHVTTTSNRDIVAESTWVYWQQAHGLTAVLGGSQTTPEAFTAACRQIVTGIYAPPAQSVDQEAVQCVHEVAIVLGNIADHVERSNSPALFIEAFVRGAGGDLFGPSLEMMEAQANLQQQFQYVSQETQRVRAILSARYGAEFPAL